MEEIAISELASVASPRAESPANTVVVAMKNRNRNYSFSHRQIDTLDTVECNGVEYSIPAAIGSSYWAILKTVFAKFNQPVYCDELAASVQELMKDRDEDRWNKYSNKTSTTVYLKIQNKSIQKNIKPWEERVIGNAKTLTRRGGKSPYGQRLQEKGFKLIWDHDQNGKPFFKMITDNGV